LGLIELADSYGILNSFWGISRLPPLVQPVGKRSYANKWIPVKDYENPDIQKVKIYSENKSAGIYRWTNKINGKTYIGSAVNLPIRLSNYYSVPPPGAKKIYGDFFKKEQECYLFSVIQTGMLLNARLAFLFSSLFFLLS
jgi:hypothetical protein